MNELPLSVIVPVWNGARDIELLLRALEVQTAPRERYEVLIVDNGSTDDTADVVRRFPFARLLHEPRAGSYAARNHAIAEARGRFLLFTDADCVPDPDWVAMALRLAEAHGEDCLIGGRVELFSVGRTGRFSVRYEELTAFQQEWNLAHGKCVTANWLCARGVLASVGNFDAALKSGGDVECAGRIAAAGHRLVYAPELVVRHPTRASLRLLVRKRLRVTGGRWQKSGAAPSLAAMSRLMLREHVEQARWMRRASTRLHEGVALVAITGVLWATAQAEMIRLGAGGKPRRA